MSRMLGVRGADVGPLVVMLICVFFFFFSSRRRHTRFDCDWSSDVCSSDLVLATDADPLVSLYTGRRTVPLYVYGYRGAGDAAVSPSEQLAFFERAGVTQDRKSVV